MDLGFSMTFAWVVGSLLAAGFACGLAMSAPAGPMAMLALIKLAEKRPAEARAIGMGTAFADATLSVVVCWGVMALGRWMADLFWDHVPEKLAALAMAPKVLWTAAALVLVGLAVQIAFFEKKQALVFNNQHRSWWLVAYGATLGNPGNFVAFAVWFSWLKGTEVAVNPWLLKIVPPLGVLAGALTIWAVFLAIAPRLLKWLPMDKVVVALRYALAGMLVAIAVTALRHAWVN